MAKFAVMVVLDLDISILDSTPASEVERITENIVLVALRQPEKITDIKMLRTKLLGLVENK